MSNGRIESDGDRHTGVCEEPYCGFQSAGWPTKTAAQERLDQHYDEHETSEPMPELKDSGIKGAV